MTEARDVARREAHALGFETTEVQNNDKLDFREVSIVGLMAALERAYNAGKGVSAMGRPIPETDWLPRGARFSPIGEMVREHTDGASVLSATESAEIKRDKSEDSRVAPSAPISLRERIREVEALASRIDLVADWTDVQKREFTQLRDLQVWLRQSLAAAKPLRDSLAQWADEAKMDGRLTLARGELSGVRRDSAIVVHTLARLMESLGIEPEVPDWQKAKDPGFRGRRG